MVRSIEEKEIEKDDGYMVGNYGLHPRCKALTTTFSLYDEIHNKENPSMVYIDVTRPMVRCR